MDGQWLPEAGVSMLQHYTVPGDRDVVFVTRKHWVTLAEPVASAIGAGIVMLFLVARLSEGFPEAGVIAFAGWLVLVGRAAYRILEWQFAWFGATRRRLMLTYGLLNRKVAMMPLEKVTDMSYSRSAWGQMLGYGEFVLESAGQDQALRTVDFLPDSDELYRILTSTMFETRDHRDTPEGEDVMISDPANEPTEVILRHRSED